VWYALGVGTKFLPALTGNPVDWLIGLIVLSGTSIAIEETLEKAGAAELLPRELCSLGFGFLACAMQQATWHRACMSAICSRPSMLFGLLASRHRWG
jgi:hypothetical protein